MKQTAKMLFHKSNIKQTLLDITFYLFSLSLLVRLVMQLFYTFKFDSWQLSEFLINYEGGFVRRGLLGEMIFLFSKTFNLNVEYVVKTISLVSLLAVSIFFIKAFIKKGYSLYLLPLCFFLGMGILSNYWVRKDYLMIYFLISILRVYKGNFVMITKITIINILIIFMLLTHEVFAFFSLPILFLLFFDQYKMKGFLQSLIISIIYLLPSISCFILTLIYHGNTETVIAITDSWQILSNNTMPKSVYESLPAVASLGWTSEFAFKYHLQSNFLYVDKGIFSSIVWLFTFPIAYYISTNSLQVFKKDEGSFTHNHKIALSTVLIFQLFCLIPVFVFLSCDYIRIFFYWIVSSYAIFLIIPIKKIENLFPSFLYQKIKLLNDYFSFILPPKKTTLTIIMLFFGISVSFCSTDQIISTSMLYNVLILLSKPFLLLKELQLF